MTPVFRKLRRAINRWWWVGVVVLAVASLGLGVVGFSHHFTASGKPASWWDCLYLALQLFTLESGAVEGAAPWELQIARFLAPVVAAYAAARALWAIFYDQLQAIRLRLWRDHVIVCGLGKKGARLVEQLRSRGDKVVVIESDPGNDQIPHCRDLGAIVRVGSASREWVLDAARVHRAKALLSVTGSDGVNVETAMLAHRLNARRSGPPLRCIVHVVDVGLQSLFRQHEIFVEESDPFELEFFNVFEIAARAMLREPFTQEPVYRVDGAEPHLLIVGLGRMGQTLLRRALKDWRIDRPSDSDRLRITVIDQEAHVKERWFRAWFPRLDDVCDVTFHSLDVRDPQFGRADFVADGTPEFTYAFVCLGDESLALFAAMALRRQQPPDRLPIVVRVAEEAGLAALLQVQQDGQSPVQGIRAVGLLELTCRLESVLDGTRELLAQAIHQAYVRMQIASGATRGTSESLLPWNELREDLKASNRDQAADIPQKLKAIGYRLVPQPEGEIDPKEFTPEQIEELAEREHQRWMRERENAGWRLGPKNVEDRTSPYLVPWTELSEDVKDYDRHAVRILPSILAKADFRIQPDQ